MKEPDQDQEETISSFINKNINLLTAFGIFNALTIFFAQVTGKKFSLFLSFGFMTLSVLTWTAIQFSMAHKKRSSGLMIFQELFKAVTIGLVLFWSNESTKWGALLIFLSLLLVLFAEYHTKLKEAILKVKWIDKYLNTPKQSMITSLSFMILVFTAAITTRIVNYLLKCLSDYFTS